MFAPLAPILATDATDSNEACAVVVRVEALAQVLSAAARLAGCQPLQAADPLAQSADLSSHLAAMPQETTRVVARDLATMSVMLQAGLLALEKARGQGRFSRAAARLLYAEAAAHYRQALAAAGFTTRS